MICMMIVGRIKLSISEMVEKRGTDDRLASEYNIAYTSSRCVEVSNAVRNGLGKMNQCAGCIGRREDIDLMLMSFTNSCV